MRREHAVCSQDAPFEVRVNAHVLPASQLRRSDAGCRPKSLDRTFDEESGQHMRPVTSHCADLAPRRAQLAHGRISRPVRSDKSD